MVQNDYAKPEKLNYHQALGIKSGKPKLFASITLASISQKNQQTSKIQISSPQLSFSVASVRTNNYCATVRNDSQVQQTVIFKHNPTHNFA